ncbi:MAG: VWA domain-containing protein [Lachnospiraceae bacterium]|nr:VWA domain-containing protein [Lachnospiraceae bacterium]
MRIAKIVITTAFVLCLLAGVSFSEVARVVAASQTSTGWDLSKSKEATNLEMNLDENYESQVTLSLPSANYTGNLDVVFVLDGSTSHDNTNLAAQAAVLLKELTAYENLTIKVGVVIFGGYNPILASTDLLDLDTNLKTLQDFLTTDYKSMDGRSGSNLQAGVEKARALLNADTTVDSSDKYMIILTDGGARMWYDSASGEAMSDAYAYGTSVWWNSNEDWHNRYGVTGTESYVSETAPTFESVWNDGQSGIDIGKYGLSYSEHQNVLVGDTTITYASWDTAMHAEDYYTTYEAACYYAATSIVAASQEVNVCMVTYEYYSNTTYTTFTEQFKTWLEDYVTRYNINQTEDIDEETAAAVFAEVKDELIQLVDAGSAVVDEMGETADYDFDFINDINELTLTVDNVAYAVTQIDDTSYGFGSSTGNEDKTKSYQFVLIYYENGTTYSDTTYGECFILYINVPITKNDQVQLTYSVILTNPQKTAGTYGTYDQYGDNNDGSDSYDLYTNNVATLYPVDSDGNPGTSEDFQKPTVSYTVVEEPETLEEEDTPETETPEEDDTPEPETEEDDTSEPETTEETTTEEVAEKTVEETVDENVDPTAVESAPTGDNASIEVFIALATICGVAVSTLLLQARREQEQ